MRWITLLHYSSEREWLFNIRFILNTPPIDVGFILNTPLICLITRPRLFLFLGFLSTSKHLSPLADHVNECKLSACPSLRYACTACLVPNRWRSVENESQIDGRSVENESHIEQPHALQASCCIVHMLGLKIHNK